MQKGINKVIYMIAATITAYITNAMYRIENAFAMTVYPHDAYCNGTYGTLDHYSSGRLTIMNANSCDMFMYVNTPSNGGSAAGTHIKPYNGTACSKIYSNILCPNSNDRTCYSTGIGDDIIGGVIDFEIFSAHGYAVKKVSPAVESVNCGYHVYCDNSRAIKDNMIMVSMNSSVHYTGSAVSSYSSYFGQYLCETGASGYTGGYMIGTYARGVSDSSGAGGSGYFVATNCTCCPADNNYNRTVSADMLATAPSGCYVEGITGNDTSGLFNYVNKCYYK